MGGITRIIEKLGFGERVDLDSRTAPKPGPGETGAAPDLPPHGAPSVEQRASADDPILQSLKMAWSRLLNEGLPRHLKVAPDDALFLERIEITADGEAFQILLTRFMNEFRPQARIDYVKRELAKDLQRNLVLDEFTGIWPGASDNDAADTEAPNADAFDENLAGPGSGSKGNFEVRLIGHWGEKLRAHTASGRAAPVQRVGARLRLTLWDGDSPAGRDFLVESYPTALGRKGDPGDVDAKRLPIAGTYVSGLHGILDWDGVAITVSDGPSRNGLWLNDVRVAADRPLRLKAGDWLRFSSSDDRDVSRYPRLRIDSVERATVAGQTPVTTPVTGATPVTKDAAGEDSSPTSPVLAVLTINDAAGSHQVDLAHLPFRIGRSYGQDYVVPDANAGASGSHLEILDLDELGARVHHPAFAKNGCSWADSAEERLPASFHWPFGKEILLAPRFTKAPVVRLILRKVA